MSNDLHANLTISAEEARHGTIRSLTLPDGRAVTVSVPAGAYAGQALYFPGQGGPASASGPAGPLILTLSIHQETSMQAAHPSTPGVMPIYSPSAPTSMSSGKIIVLVLALVLLVAGIGGIGFAVYRNQVIGQQNEARFALETNETSTASVQNTVAAESASATAVAKATAAVNQANPDPYGAGGTLVAFDPLTSEGSSGDPYMGMDRGTNCLYQNGAFHVIDTAQQSISKCDVLLLNSSGFSNFVVEIQLKLLKGDLGGLFFRDGSGEGYMLSYDKTGHYQFLVYTFLGSDMKTLAQGQTPAFRSGYNQTNTLGLIAQGSTFIWYVNGQRAGSASDGHFANGKLTLLSSDYAGNSTPSDAAYTNLRIWRLS